MTPSLRLVGRAIRWLSALGVLWFAYQCDQAGLPIPALVFIVLGVGLFVVPDA
jgi:hypothetical protein